VGELVHDLAKGADLIETHISWVLLGRTTVLKLKKPVNLGFLDFSSLEKRRLACESEVVLNQRLSDGVYQRVVAIERGAGGVHTVVDYPNGDRANELVDYAVKMRRLDDAGRADKMLANGLLTKLNMEQIAARLARFHATAARSTTIDEFGTVAAIVRNVEENFDQTRHLARQYISQAEEDEIERRQLGFLAAHGDLFAGRVRDGKVCDGHGDLRLEHVYFRRADVGGPSQTAATETDAIDVIDCIEFNERFRFGDACADLAFLTMDLRHSGRGDLAEDLLAEYAKETSDYDLYALVDFYESYRAYVRAKVASFLAADESASVPARGSAERTARSYYLQALSFEHEPLRQPVMVAVGGLIASGKSTTSQTLAALLHCPVVSSDRTRKFLLGAGAERKFSATAFSGPYSNQFTAQVYTEVLRRGSAVLASGRSVVVDATFRSANRRNDLSQLAAKHQVPLLFVECQVPRETALTRLRERAKAASVSDGRQEIYDEFADSWEPLASHERFPWIAVDTTRPNQVTESQLREALGTLRSVRGGLDEA
jgi:hypothetical protein